MVTDLPPFVTPAYILTGNDVPTRNPYYGEGAYDCVYCGTVSDCIPDDECCVHVHAARVLEKYTRFIPLNCDVVFYREGKGLPRL